MTIPLDGNFILTAILVMLQVATIVAVAITKFNDLAHLEKDVKKINNDFSTSIARLQQDSDNKHNENKEKIDKILDKIIDYNAAIAAQRAVCEERHKQN